jgi:hypothetical protein
MSQLADHPCKFMPKYRRRHDHFSVVAALEHLEIRTARERGLDLDPHLARL